MAKRIFVFSGKGGVGKSSVTACLASALATLGKKVLLVDADIGFRSLDLIMDIGSGIVFNWLDVIEKLCKPAQALFVSDNSVALLTAPQDSSESITEVSIDEMLSEYDADFDYIFIDSPAGAGDIHNMFLKACHKAIIIATPDAVSVRSAAAAADKAFDVDNGLEISLIINRFNKQEVISSRQMKLDDVIDAVKAQLLGVIPEDDSVRLLPEGKKLAKYASDAFVRIAKRMNGEHIPFNPKNFY